MSTVTLTPFPPSGDLHDCSCHNTNLLQLPPSQTRHQGGAQERPIRCQAHPQTHRCLRVQDLRPLGEERSSPEQSSTFREHSQDHPAVVNGRGQRAGPTHLVISSCSIRSLFISSIATLLQTQSSYWCFIV